MIPLTYNPKIRQNWTLVFREVCMFVKVGVKGREK